MAFPDDAELGTRLEFQMGTVWTDVTPDARLEQLITVTRGRADESSQVSPSKVQAQINNPDGRYSPRNAEGPSYGKFGRNTPARVSIAAGTPWLDHPQALAYRVSTPSTAELQITGDMDLRWDVETSNWDSLSGSVELGGKWGGAGQNAWHAYLFAGTARLVWTTDGTTENTAAASISSTVHTRRLTVRITVDVNNGAGGRTIQFFTGPGMSGPWTQIGVDNVFAGTTATASSTAGVEIGDNANVLNSHVPARIYAAQIRSGIGGTLVASPDFTARTPGALTFTDSTGVPWTANSAAAITNRSIRGTGEVPSWPARWGTSGRLVKTAIEPAGIMRRLAQGASPLDSTLRRRITSYASTVAYWPMEDGQGASQLYSPVAGVQPAPVAGAQLASDDSLAGSTALPAWPAGSYFSARVPSYAASSSWQVQHVYRLDTAPGVYATMLTIQTTGTVRQWQIAFQAGGVRVRGVAADGTLVVDQITFVGTDIIGPWTRQNFTVTQSGTTVLWHIGWIVIGNTGGTGDYSFTGTSGQVTGINGAPYTTFNNLRLGHVAVFSDANATAYDGADTGFDGDTAVARAVRLCGEEGVPLVTPYGRGGTQALGPQRPDTLLNLLGEAASVDVGILYEPRDAITLALRPRASIENQAPALTLDYAGKQIVPPLEPEDDDQQTRNDVTRSRPSGSSARVTLDTGPLSTGAPPGGVGRYTDSQTINVHTDDQLIHAAGWALHLGTYDGIRYPAVTIDLARCPELIDAARNLEIGDRVKITNPPQWLPPDTIDLIVQQITETLGVRTWKMTLTCTPGGPWSVGVLGDAVLGHLDTAGSALSASATQTATALVVGTTVGPQWITTASRPGDFPLDLRLGGEVVTASGITGAVEDTFTRTTSSGWGTADTGQAWTSTGGSAADFSTNGTTGRHSLTSVNVARVSVTGPSVADFDVVASVSTSALAAGASHFVYLAARYTSANDHLVARLEFTTSATVIVSIRKRVAGTETQLSTTTTALTHAAAALFRLRFQGAGSSLQAKVWLAAGVEPDLWDTAVVDSSVTAAGTVGVRSMLGTGNSNTLPITAVWDGFALTNPQQVTVTRSVNGVVKAQSSGTAVEVAQPLILGL